MTKRTRGSGSLLKRGRFWWIRYSVDGRRCDESSRSEKKTDAVKLLRQRLTEVDEGRYQGPQATRLTFEDLAGMVTDHYDGRRSAKRLGGALGHLHQHFGHYRAKAITADKLTWYLKVRRTEGAADGTIKFELAILRKAMNLALRADKLQRVVPFPTIKLENARTGFFEPDEFDALKASLAEHHKGWAEFAYLTGWRLDSEVLPLQWPQVDFRAGVVRLEPGTTKSGKGREFPFDIWPELGEVLKHQRVHTDEVERAGGQIVPWVFHNDGKPVKDIRWAWKAACKDTGLVGKIPHDFRRTAVRRLERAGVSRSVAMKLVGHETEAMYSRYAIVAEADLKEGVAKLAQFKVDNMDTRTLPFSRKGTRTGTDD